MPPKKEFRFQVKLDGGWQDYTPQEDKILKRAFISGFPNAKFSLRKQEYVYDFKRMVQVNSTTGKEREIRPPYKWKAPLAPVTKPGPTLCVKVPSGGPGTTIQVPHPRVKGAFIAVAVPATAKAGQAMLVPVPPADGAHSPGASVGGGGGEGFGLPAAAPVPAPSAPPAADVAAAVPAKAGKPGSSTGAKVAMGVGGVAAVGGLAVAGALLGEHIAEEGWDATMADLGEGIAGVGEAIGDGAEAVVDWTGDAATTVGDFVMDLF